MPDPNPTARDAAPPTTSPVPNPAPVEDEGPLSEEDEALLRDLGGWLHARALHDAEGSGPEIVIAPPLPPLGEAETKRRVDAVLGRGEGRAVARPATVDARAGAANGRSRRAWLKVLSHGAVAVATLAIVQLLATSESSRPAGSPAYLVELHSDYVDVYGPPDGVPVFTPTSTLELVLRTNDTWPSDDALELVIRAQRAGVSEGSGIAIPVPPEHLQIHGSEIVYMGRTASEALDLPRTNLLAGRWTLTFEVGPPGACMLQDADRCAVVGSQTIVLREPGGANAP